MAIDVDKILADRLARQAEEDQLNQVDDFTFDASVGNEPIVTEQTPVEDLPLPAPGRSSSNVQSNVPTPSGDPGVGTPEAKPVPFAIDDTFYDLETDTVIPGASFAHRVNEQYWHGPPDLDLTGENEVDWDSNIDRQGEAFLKKLGSAVPRMGRALMQDVEILAKTELNTPDVLKAHSGAMREAIASNPQGIVETFQASLGVHKAAWDAFTAPFKETAGGLDRTEFLEEFNRHAVNGDSFELIDLAERARGAELSSSEKNQITARYERDANYRQLALDTLSQADHNRMLKYQADRWANPDRPWMYGKFDWEHDTDEYYRRSVSEAAANGQWLKATWLSGQNVAGELVPVVASFAAGGKIGAVVRGASAAKKASVVQLPFLKFSPELLASAPRTGITMGLITPGTAEEKMKSAALMTAYAATGAVSGTFSTHAKRWAADIALNSGVSGIVNPMSDHMFEWGGMYREMMRQAEYEGEAAGFDDKQKTALKWLYASTILGPDIVMGRFAATSGKALQGAVKKARIEHIATHHWLRTEWEGQLRQTKMTQQERDTFLDNSMGLMATAADFQGKPFDDFVKEHLPAEDGFGIRVRRDAGEVVIELKNQQLNFPQDPSGLPSTVDTQVGDQRAKGLRDLVLYQRFGDDASDVAFEPARVTPEMKVKVSAGLETARAAPEKVFKAYQDHPQLGPWMSDNGIRNYSDLVEVSYDSLRRDIDEIFPMLGVGIEKHTGDGMPYATTRQAMEDIRDNRRLMIMESDGSHAELGTGRGRDENGLTYQDKLNAIRMFFGHNGGAHDVTDAGLRNTQAILAGMFSDGGNLALASEVGVADTLTGDAHKRLGIDTPMIRSTDGTAEPSSRPEPVEALRTDVDIDFADIEPKRVFKVFDDFANWDTIKIEAWSRSHPAIKAEDLFATAQHWAGEADRIAKTGAGQEAIDATVVAQHYREAAQNKLNADEGRRQPGPRANEPVILTPDLADWRAGLVQKDPEGVLADRLPPELLRPIKRQLAANQKKAAHAGRVVHESNSKNAETQERTMDALLSRFAEKDITQLDVWEDFWFQLTGETDIPVFPEGLRRLKEEGSKAYTELIRSMTNEQMNDFVSGLRTTDGIRDAYTSGRANKETTALVSLWGALSPGLNNYPHESAFMEVILGNGQMRNFFKKAEAGTFNQKEYLDWVESFYPKGAGKTGVAAKTNLNNFGKLFLQNFYKPLQNGKYKGQRAIDVLHGLLSDPNVTGKQLRREWYKMIDPKGAVGIDVKVLSFMSILVGKRDVMVLDRVQTQHIWDMDQSYGFKNAYDGIPKPRTQKRKNGVPQVDSKGRPVLAKKTSRGMANILTGHRSIALYEAFEAVLEPIARQGMKDAGLPYEDIGAWHWATWVKRGEQEVSHSTLQGLERMTRGVDDPFIGTSVMSGNFKPFFYGFKNVYFGHKGPDDFRHVYTTQDGKEFIMDTQAMKAMKTVGDAYKSNNKEISYKGNPIFVRDANGKQIKITDEDRFLPRGFTYSQEKTANGTDIPTDRPWTERDDINLPKFDRWIERLGVRPNAAEADIIATGSDSTGLRAPRRGGVREFNDKAGVLAQENPGDGLLGATSFLRDGKKAAYVLRTSEPSTAHHEFFHIFFDMLTPAQRDVAAEAIRPLGFDVAAEGWTRGALEAVTRQYERFLVDGQAPAAELQGMFSLLSKHVAKSYGKIAGSPIGQEVLPEVREFFDKLYVPDGKYKAPSILYVEREEKDQHSLIEAYDAQNGVTRADPQEVGQIARDIARIRLELGPSQVNADRAAQMGSGLPVNTVPYRTGRKVYKRLLRAAMGNEVAIDRTITTDMSQAWVRSAQTAGNKTLNALQDALVEQGFSRKKANKAIAEMVDKYARGRELPTELENLPGFKRKIGQMSKKYSDWVQDTVGPVVATRHRDGFEDIPVLEALAAGAFQDAQSARSFGLQDQGVTNVHGTYNNVARAKFDGFTAEQTARVKDFGHSTLIPDVFRPAEGWNFSSNTLDNTTYQGKPVTLYAYHPGMKQLIPGKPGQPFERLTEFFPNSKLSEWVRVDLSGDGDIVGTSGSRDGQVEAYSALRSTDPYIRWVPDAEQVPGFFGADGAVLDSGGYTPDGPMGEYVVYPQPRSQMFTGRESVEQALATYDSPEFRSWQRRVANISEPEATRDMFAGIDSSPLTPEAKKSFKDSYMRATEEVNGLDHIDAEALLLAMPGKGRESQRNMILAVQRGGDVQDMAIHFNNLQDRSGNKFKLHGMDLTKLAELRKTFVLGENEVNAAREAARIAGAPESFFQEVIRSGEVVFPDDVNSEGFKSMVTQLVRIQKKRAKADAFSEKLNGPLDQRNRGLLQTFGRYATNMRYAWDRLASEVGNLEISKTFRRAARTSRRGGHNVETRFQGFFRPDSIKEQLKANGEAVPKGKIKDQLYPLIRDNESQQIILRWLGTEPSNKEAFAKAQTEFKRLKPEFKGVAYGIRQELQGASAVNLRKMQHHQWAKVWESIRDEYTELRTQDVLTKADSIKLEQMQKRLDDALPWRQGKDGENNAMTVDEMIEVNNKAVTLDSAGFHEFLKTQDWGSRKHYWLTKTPDQYDQLLAQFSTSLGGLPTAQKPVKAEATALPGSINPRQGEVELKTENMLNNLLQHMHRYEVLSHVQKDAEFLVNEVNKMTHLTDGERRVLQRNLKNIAGFGDPLSGVMRALSGSNRLFWNSYIMNMNRLAWYTVRNKAQPYALMASQFSLNEMRKATPEWLKQSTDPGSGLRKAFAETFQQDIAEGGAFARQALTDSNTNIGEVRSSRMGQWFDKFMNSALPFSDKLNRMEVYGMGYTLADRAVRDFQSGRSDLADVQNKLNLKTLDPTEQLTLNTMLNKGQWETFRREYAAIKNQNVNFAYRTGERGMFIQDAASRTLASLSTWPLGAAEIVARNAIKPMVDGVLLNDLGMASQGVKAMVGYMAGMYFVGEAYSLIFGDKGGKAYHPVYSSISMSIEGPGIGWTRQMFDDGIDSVHKAQVSRDVEDIDNATSKVLNRAMYMLPALPMLANWYEGLSGTRGVGPWDLTKSTALGSIEGIVDYMESSDITGDMPEGVSKYIADAVQERILSEGYSEYRTLWEGAMHTVLGTFEESNPDRWDRSTVGDVIHEAIVENVQKAKEFMEEGEFEKVVKKFKGTHNIDLEEF